MSVVEMGCAGVSGAAECNSLGVEAVLTEPEWW